HAAGLTESDAAIGIRAALERSAISAVAMLGKTDAFLGDPKGAQLEGANQQRHVTAKALDGLSWMIGEEERKTRSDPVAAGSAILRKVFGR
ncbi:MAG TPA: DUF4197 family protein, partial [Burkholderiaceae bacterium]